MSQTIFRNGLPNQQELCKSVLLCESRDGRITVYFDEDLALAGLGKRIIIVDRHRKYYCGVYNPALEDFLRLALGMDLDADFIQIAIQDLRGKNPIR